MASDIGAAARSLKDAGTEVARRWAKQRLGAVLNYGRILSDYGTGQLSDRDAAGACARLAAEEAARYPSELIGLASDYAAAVARIAGLQIKGDRSRPSPIVDIELLGAPGDTLSRVFTLENPHDVDIKVAFSSACYSDGTRELKVMPTFEPADFSIPAYGEANVTVSTKLDKRYFKSGRRYAANAAVVGFEDAVIRIRLTVTSND